MNAMPSLQATGFSLRALAAAAVVTLSMVFGVGELAAHEAVASTPHVGSTQLA
jgi:hypothetical protein